MTTNSNLNIMSQKMIEEQNRIKELDKLTPTNQIKAKTTKVVAGTMIATSIVSSVVPVSAFADNRLEMSNYKGEGYISVTEEVGPNGTGGKISTGAGDYGGVSYGLTQLSTTVGSAQEFIDNYLKSNYPEFYEFFKDAGEPGTDSFNKAWTNAYNHNPGKFEDIQMEYKEKKYVNPAQKKIKEALEIDMFETRARIELLHSTSVQYGAEGMKDLLIDAGINKDMSEEEFMSTICDFKRDNTHIYFKSSSKEVQNVLKDRYAREKEELLKIVKEEQGPSLEDALNGDIKIETEDKTEEIIETAKSYLNQGTTYKMGGKNTDKLDCSGYVSLVYQDLGLNIDEMMTNAQKFRTDSAEISREELKEGDLVFWHDLSGTKHAKVFHIGIYVGNDTVVDCSIDHNGVGTRKLSSLQDKEGDRYFTFGRYEALENDTPKVIEISEEEEFTSVIEVDEEIKESSKLEENSGNEDEILDKDEEIEEENSIIDIEPDTDEEEEENSIIDTESDTNEEAEEENSIIDTESDTNEEAEEENSIIDTESNTNEEVEEDNSIIDTESNTDGEVEEDNSIIDTDNETDSNKENSESDEDNLTTDTNNKVEDMDKESDEENSTTDTEFDVNEKLEDTEEESSEENSSNDTESNNDDKTEEENSEIDSNKENLEPEEDNSTTDTDNESDEDNSLTDTDKEVEDAEKETNKENSSNDVDSNDNDKTEEESSIVDTNDELDSNKENIENESSEDNSTSNTESNIDNENKLEDESETATESNKENDSVNTDSNENSSTTDSNTQIEEEVKPEEDKTEEPQVDANESVNETDSTINSSVKSDFEIVSNTITDDIRIQQIKDNLENNNIFGKLAKMLSA